MKSANVKKSSKIFIRILFVFFLILNLYQVFNILNLNAGALLLLRCEYSEQCNIEIAIEFLNQANNNKKISSEASYLLARGYLYSWDIEPGLAYLLSDNTRYSLPDRLSSEIEIIQSINRIQNLKSLNEWKETGVTGNRFISKYKSYLYEIGENTVNEYSNYTIPFPVSVNGSIILDGEQLMKDNSPHNKLVISGEERGNILIIYGKGPIYKFITIESDGVYKFTVDGLNSYPSPIIIDLYLDGITIGSYQYEKGNDLWEEVSLEVPLNSGLHVMRLLFANDAQVSVDNKIYDRNAVISQLRIERID